VSLIVAICGVDASGKATQSRLLAEKLKGTRLAFPNYETPTGKAILAHLKNEWSVGITREADTTPTDCAVLDAFVFQALQTVNRFECLDEINAARARGPVVRDRYTASGLVYGTLDGLDPAWIEKINASLPQPNVWILLDVPVEEGFRRRPERRDRIESNRPYLEKVRDGYLKLFEKKQAERVRLEECWKMARPLPAWYTVNGLGSVEVIHEEILSIVNQARR
jgi:thymidylate kinase